MSVLGDVVEPSVGDRLHNGRFRLLAELGRGSTGLVYRALDGELEREVALKTVARAAIPDIVQLKREFRVAADLHHENLVALHGLYADERAWFFTMELVDGVDILAAVRRHPAALRRLFAQLLRGVAALHRAGVVHRDLKPSNILVTAEERVVLLDFGLSLRTAPRSSVTDGTGEAAGTVLYMAPEQLRGEPPGPAIDLYAVGVVLFEALAGAPPFTGASWQIVDAKWTRSAPSPRAREPTAAEDLSALAEALLDPSPARRPTATGARARVLARADVGSAPRSPMFVGRDDELESLRRSFAALPGGPRLVWICGESGIGKSALLQRFCESLPTASDVLVLRGRCHYQESVPFRALDSWIDELAEALLQAPPSLVAELWPGAGALCAMFPALRAVAPARDDPDASLTLGERRQQANAALRALLTALGHHRRVVVVIDDAQWADLDSVALLAAVLRGPDAPALLLVLAHRDDDDDVLAPLRELGGEVLLLGQLPDRAAATLLADAAGSAVDLTAYADEVGGNPFLLTTLADALAELDGVREPLDLRRLVERRLARLSPDADELLSLVALAGAPVLHRTALAAATSRSAGHDAASSLVKAKLLRSLGGPTQDRLQLFHDRLRAAVLGRLDAARTRGLHLRLATTLERDPASRAADLARHFAAAELPTRALPHAERAAGEAMQALAFEGAADLYRLALACSPEAREHQARLQRGLAAALAAAGRSQEAVDTFLCVAASAPAEEGARDRQQAAELLIGAGHLERGREVLAEVLARFDLRLPTSQAEALLSAAFWRARLRVRGLEFVVRPAGATNEDALARVDACWTVASSMGFFDAVRAFGFQTRHLLLSLELGDPPRLARALAMEAIYVETSGGSPRRVAELERLLGRLAEHLHAPADRAFVVVARGYRRLHAGHFAAAHADFVAAEAEYARGGAARWERNLCRTHRLFALLFLGEFAALARHEAELYAQFIATDDRASASNLGLLAGPPIALAADRPDVARARLADGLTMWGGEPPLSFAFLATVGAAQISLYEDDPATAFGTLQAAWRRLRPIMMFRSERLLLHVLRGHAAVALLARGGGHPVHRRAAAETLAELRRSGAEWIQGHASTLAASLDLHTRPDAVEPLLAAAARQFDAAHMRAHASAARLALARRRRDQSAAAAATADLAALGLVAVDRWLRTILPAPERVIGN